VHWLASKTLGSIENKAILMLHSFVVSLSSVLLSIAFLYWMWPIFLNLFFHVESTFFSILGRYFGTDYPEELGVLSFSVTIIVLLCIAIILAILFGRRDKGNDKNGWYERYGKKLSLNTFFWISLVLLIFVEAFDIMLFVLLIVVFWFIEMVWLGDFLRR